MSRSLVYEEPEGDIAEYLNKYLTKEDRAGFIKCKGFIFPKYFKNFGDSIREMEIRPDDVWVCSYPRSGTTWTQEMVWCIANDMDFEGAKEEIDSRFPFLEVSSMRDFQEMQAKRPGHKYPDFLFDSFGYVNRRSSPRFIKTHLPFTLLPEELQQNKTTAKIVHVARNSRDTCVSRYYHHKILHSFPTNDLDFEIFGEMFLKGADVYGPFWEHLIGYWQQEHNPNILFLTYEEMKKDLRQVIYKTAKFLGKTLLEDQVDKLMNHLSFNNMKNNASMNKVKAYSKFMKKFQDNSVEKENLSFIRRGKVDGWKEIMTPDMAERFEKWDSRTLEEYQQLPVYFHYEYQE